MTLQEVFHRLDSCQLVQYEINGKTRSFDAWFALHDLRIGRDMIFPIDH